MENVEYFANLFSSLGVPVACLIVVFYLWNKERDQHKEEVSNLTQTINNNTIALEKLLEVMRQHESK